MDFAGSSRDPGGTGKVVSVVKEMSDEELVDRMAGGDERALSELYARYARPVYTMGIRLLGDSHLAEELVQDAFTNVWRGVTKFDLERGSFMTWSLRQ
jgi:DNA-directed RNA polymerase specialized sigma24 family protein